MASISVKPYISGGRTLSKMYQGGKGSSAPKKRSRRQMWGQSGNSKAPVVETRRIDRPGINGKHVRARLLICGHTVLMIKHQRPSPDTYCVQCNSK